MSYEVLDLEALSPRSPETLLEFLQPYSYETDVSHQMEYLNSIEGLSESAWSELSPTERLEKLKELEARLAEIQGRSPRLVLTRSYPDGFQTLGDYDFEREVISINEELIRAPEHRLKAIETIAHEGRHAFQHDAVRGLVPYDPQIIAYWKANGEHYLPPSKFGIEIYRSQPLELDARSFAARIVDEFRTGVSEVGYASYDGSGPSTTEFLDEGIARQFGPLGRSHFG